MQVRKERKREGRKGEMYLEKGLDVSVGGHLEDEVQYLFEIICEEKYLLVHLEQGEAHTKQCLVSLNVKH